MIEKNNKIEKKRTIEKIDELKSGFSEIKKKMTKHY